MPHPTRRGRCDRDLRTVKYPENRALHDLRLTCTRTLRWLSGSVRRGLESRRDLRAGSYPVVAVV